MLTLYSIDVSYYIYILWSHFLKVEKNLDHWRSDHSNFKSYLSNYKSDLDHRRKDYIYFKSYFSHNKSDLGHWSHHSDLKMYLSHYSYYKSATEELITTNLKFISATIKVILATEEVITAILKIS